MILQKQTKTKYKSDALSRKQLSDFFNDYEKEEKEYDTLWDNWLLSESIHCHQDYGGEYAGSGTLDYVEGLILYTLIRKNKPKTVFEIGTAQGMSAALMASAIEANQNNGKIFCVDKKLPHRMSPTFSKAMEDEFIEFYEADVFEFLDEIKEIPDLVFVDADHREEFCMKITKILADSFPNAIYAYHEWSLSTISQKPETEYISRSEWLHQFYERPAFELYFNKPKYKHNGFVGSCGLGVVTQ
jgi:hypothetical protein